ncbi:MAG: hypothetical protein EHM45_00930 [Desulfobacteraceae bacterium]|nr:MAG: hypothetical protein EHM45_00930 [Desulfobacteraceae bacterium]
MIFFWGTHGVQRSIERLLVILIIGILATILFHTYIPLVQRARVLNGLSFGLEQFKREIAYHWALYGQWPADATGMEVFSSDSTSFIKDLPNRIKKAEVENGAIHVFFKGTLAGHVLTCRPAVLKKNTTGSIIWVCGAVQPGPTAWDWIGPDRTNIDNNYIPKNLRYY